jgi:hypothetical protein
MPQQHREHKQKAEYRPHFLPELQDLSHLPRWIRRKVAISVVQARMPYSGMPQQPKSSARILAETTFNLDPGCKLTGRCE